MFGADSFPYPDFIERAHRLQGRQDRNIPRALIMHFLNYKDKERMIQAAQGQRKSDVSTAGGEILPGFCQRDTHVKKRFDEVK